MKSGSLYKLDFASGKSYIGITRCSPALKRFWAHAARARHGYESAVAAAWRKYGQPKFAVLAVLPIGMLGFIERRAISAYGTLTPDGYNVTAGGENPEFSPETRRKLSTSLKGLKRGPYLAEHRASISMAKKAQQRTHSPETRAKISAALSGKVRGPLSDEHKRTLSLSKTGKSKRQPPWSEETRQKITAAMRGRVISAEQRAKISASLTGRPNILLQGRPLSDHHRAKLKAAWERRRIRNAGQFRYCNASP